MDTIDSIRCCVCGELMEASSNEYLRFHGNVFVGINGGLIGNNLDEEGRVIKDTFVCKTTKCIKKILYLDEE